MSSYRKLEIRIDLPKITKFKWICPNKLTHSGKKFLTYVYFIMFYN